MVYYDLSAESGFASAFGAPLGWYGTVVVHGDFDGGGRTDVVSAGCEIALVRGAPGGGFQPAVYLPWSHGGSPREGAAVDLEGDGDFDLVLMDEVTSMSLLNNGAGSFAPGLVVPIVGAVGLAAVDDDGDGDSDLFFQNWGALRLAVNLSR